MFLHNEHGIVCLSARPHLHRVEALLLSHLSGLKLRAPESGVSLFRQQVSFAGQYWIWLTFDVTAITLKESVNLTRTLVCHCLRLLTFTSRLCDLFKLWCLMKSSWKLLNPKWCQLSEAVSVRKQSSWLTCGPSKSFPPFKADVFCSSRDSNKTRLILFLFSFPHSLWLVSWWFFFFLLVSSITFFKPNKIWESLKLSFESKLFMYF